jgi:trk system potassium uptake protein TrkA/voltage-gated potassium channel
MLTSPTRNLIGGVVFVLAVSSLGIVGYMSQGWSIGNALCMAVLTAW